MPTFLHIADVHLDSAFTAHFNTRQAEERRKEQCRCVSDIIDRAGFCDLLLIAGDLFDTPRAGAESVAFLKQKFSEIPNTHIFITAGNHDPFTENSVYANEDFGDNVHIFSTEGECVEIPELGVRVYGISFSSQFQDERLNIPKIEKKDGVADILVLHGDLTSKGGNSRYNMIDRDFLENCGADYVALGHIHKRSEIDRAGSTYFAYPGIPEGRGFDECGDMGGYVGAVEGGIVSIKFERFCIRRNLAIPVDISGAENNIEASLRVLNTILEVGSESDIYRIKLCGAVKPGVINAGHIQNELSEKVHYAEIDDNTHADINIDLLAKQNTLCGEFIRLMHKKGASEEAILLGVEVLLGGDTR